MLCARSAYIHIPILILLYCSLALHLLNAVFALDHWWSAFWMNRVFDLLLIYIASCAIYRIRRLRHKKKGAPLARPQSSRLLLSA